MVVLRGLAFALWMLLCSFLALPVVLVSPRRATAAIARLWARGTLRLCGVRAELILPEAPLAGRTFLVMANHTSHFDVLSLLAVLPFRVRFVAKRELVLIPVFGWVLALGAAIVIDRGNRRKAVRSIARARKALEGGESVLMFPEGTRTPPGELGPLKKGPFHLALETHAPVLPIGITGTGAILAKGDWRIHPGPVTIRVGEPIAIDPALGDDVPNRERLSVRVAGDLRALIAGST